MHRSCASTTSEGSRPQDRLKKNIIDWSIKTKGRKVVDLVKLWSAGELTTTSEIAHRLSGQRNVVTSIRKSTETLKRRKSTDVICGGRQLSSDEALDYYVDSKCTSHSYKQTRKWSLKPGHEVFPSYHNLCIFFLVH